MADYINGKFGGGVKAWLMTDTNSAHVLGKPRGFFVIRPDGYIGLIADLNDELAVNNYLSRF
ncbi:MAG TPA: hypothetical protein VGI43_19540 [Mucilaginibacter sp.]